MQVPCKVKIYLCQYNNTMKLSIFFCKVIGHKINSSTLFVLDLMQTAALNKEEFKDRYEVCSRCDAKVSFIK